MRQRAGRRSSFSSDMHRIARFTFKLVVKWKLQKNYSSLGFVQYTFSHKIVVKI